MFIMKVEIKFKDGNKGFYKVGSACELTFESGPYLAMRRLEDGEFGCIPMDIIESWKLLD